MKKFLLGAAAVVALGAPAMAADMPVKAAPPVTVVDVYSWTGFYIGGNFGAGWGRASYENTANTSFFGDVAGPPGFSHRVKGALGGGQFGYNYQSGNIVFGVEATFDAANIDGSINPLRGGLAPLGQDDNFTANVRSLFLATGRVGFARTTGWCTPRADMPTPASGCRSRIRPVSTREAAPSQGGCRVGCSVVAPSSASRPTGALGWSTTA